MPPAGPAFDRDAFTQASLRSERVRIICMMSLMAVIVGLGVYRTLYPLGGGVRVGLEVLAITGVFLAYESAMLVLVNRLMKLGRNLPQKVWRTNAVVEVSLPVLGMYLVYLTSDLDPYTILVSPAYPIIMLMIVVSILHLDPTLSAISGFVGTAGYLSMFAVVAATGGGERANPHPNTIYLNLGLLLGVGTGVAMFVAARVRGYVRAAVREVETRRQMDRMQRDLELASEIQRSLLPESMPDVPGFDLAAMSRSADTTGGDYYDWQDIGGGRLVVSLADVTGHGIGPAMVTAACRAYVRATVHGEAAPIDVVNRVNRLLHDDMPPGRFVTFAMLEIDPSRRRGVFLSAGHGPSFHVRGRDGAVTSIAAQGLPLGLGLDEPMDEAVLFDFTPGDVVVLFSDGFFEWGNADNEHFGLERLSQVVHDHRHESARGLISRMDAAVRAFVGQQPQSDDMTAVVVKCLE